MVFFRGDFAVAAASAILLILSQPANSFVNKPSFIPAVRNSSTEVHLKGFLNEGKKALVKSLAGDYDAAAIRARMDGLVKDNSVLMLSFVT
jgi:hypothetical protein